MNLILVSIVASIAIISMAILTMASIKSILASDINLANKISIDNESLKTK